MEIFPETLGPELDIPNCGFTFATGTYLTGVTEIHSEGSRFGRPSTKGLHHEEGIHSLVKAPQGNVQEIDAVHKFVNTPESLNKEVCGTVDRPTNRPTK